LERDDETLFEGRHEPTGLGPWILLLPVLALVFGVLWARSEARRVSRRPAVAPPASTEGTIAGWFATSDHAGGRIEWRLTPLHGEPRRQRFDTLALRRRLERRNGQPWQLAVEYVPASGATTMPEPLAVADFRVEDAAGVALETLSPRGPGPNGLHDPLRVLLDMSTDQLVPGREAVFFLWGRRPEGNAVLRTSIADLAPLPLRVRDVARSELERSLARLDIAEDQ